MISSRGSNNLTGQRDAYGSPLWVIRRYQCGIEFKCGLPQGTKLKRQTRRLNTRPEVKDRLRGFLVLAALIATLAVAIDFVFLVRIAERSRIRSVRSNKFLPSHCVLIQAVRANTRESSLRIEDRLRRDLAS
jgi:hypothetical protein